MNDNRDNADRPKVFGIGLSKTGTTSLARALEILGYRTRDYLGVEHYAKGDLSSIDLHMIDEHDAFTDTPIPSFYRELDRQYPGSRFILTTRNMDDWLKSCRKQFTERITARQNQATASLHTDLYGCFAFDADKYANGYERHVEGVLDYFRDRPRDLLVVDICSGENWEKLCNFLDRPVPDANFPVTNVSSIQWLDIGKIGALARQAGRDATAICLGHGPGRFSRLAHRVSEQLQGMLGYDASALEQERFARGASARERATESLVEGIGKLNASVPVLSAAGAQPPYAERSGWEHAWLVDATVCLGNDKAGTCHVCINIALIEGGRPIWGVVYLPDEDMLYYAKGSGGAWSVHGNGPATKLTATTRGEKQARTVLVSGNQPMPPEARRFVEARLGEQPLVVQSDISGLCRLAEGSAALFIATGEQKECESAAGHAIARAAGIRLRSLQGEDEPAYNKPVQITGPFIAEAIR